MKDKKWLKEEIESKFHRWYNSTQSLNSLVADVNNSINQLDEPEVLSQEWIENKKWQAYDPDARTLYWAVTETDLENLLVPKQELPVIPKYVADWIEDLKSKRINLLENIYDFTHGEDIHDYIREQGDTLMRAWLDGFTVEEEQKYYAKLKEIRPLEGEWLTNLSGPNYYVLDTKGLMLGEFILDLVGMKTKASTHTLKDWERYGINDSNADFVKVEESEE